MPPKGFQRRKANASDGASTPQIPSLAEQLSYLENPRPFKNPNYVKKTSARRSKNLKAVLTQERERERAEREKRRLEKIENGMDVDGEPSIEEEEVLTCECLPFWSALTWVIQSLLDTSIEAPPSLLPQKHYCDITGLEAPYTDPATKLRYHDKSIYELIKGLSASSVKEYLAARGVNSIVK
ncbi:hypothetical protein B0H16DRAFT_961607 [Mycena metata]|uniref:Vps72/YL1 C-terminal domain-containing protein n=1 Tax=Mycena metata TaxID=1033252 RepID=A0AAD7IM70_9AGAR|nr:hypothetical protein B0H16DRAFT_961607 [Mycena metata]